MHRLITFFVLTALALALPAAAQTTRCVKPSGPGGPGPWASATASLTTALGAAVSGDEIWIAAGTYTPAPANGDRRLSFVIPSGVRVYGGFAGTETLRSQRPANTALNPTILSGDLNANDPPNTYGGVENTYRVVIVSNTSNTTLLDRLTIRGGNSQITSPFFPGTPTDLTGAGVYGTNAQLTFSDCTIRDNQTGVESANNLFNRYGFNGGGVALDNSSVSFVRCTITANRTASGTGSSCTSGVGQTGGIGGSGGGVYLNTSSANFTDCTLSSNVCGDGDLGAGCSFMLAPGRPGGSGGAIAALNSSPTFLRCEFSANRSGNGGRGGSRNGGGTTNGPGGDGGAVWLSSGAAPSFTSCRFFNNTTGNGGSQAGDFNGSAVGAPGGKGAAIAFTGAFADIVINSCLFHHNTTGNGGAGGVTLACSTNGGPGGDGGALAFAATGNLRVSNCTLADNTTGTGGAGGPPPQPGPICSPTIPGARGGGSAIWGNAGPRILANTIIWNNTPAADQLTPGASTSVYNSLIQNGFAGTLVIADDPRFLNTTSYALAPLSPAIDRGDSSYTLSIANDAAGNPRTLDDPRTPDRGFGPTPRPDIGAREYITGPCPADVNASGSVTVQDLFDFLGSYFTQGPSSDFNASGTVSVQDIFSYLAAYFTGCP